MIHHFDPPERGEQETTHRYQWLPAVGAGLIAGLVLLMVPRGSPWASLTFFAPTVVGRVIPAESGMAFASVLVLHLALSLVYGLIVSWSVSAVTQLRALLVGGVVGLMLYLVNLGIVTVWIPQLRGNEISVAFTHLVFGAVCGGAYRGLLHRRRSRVPAPT